MAVPPWLPLVSSRHHWPGPDATSLQERHHQRAPEQVKSQTSLLKYLGLVLPQGLGDQARPSLPIRQSTAVGQRLGPSQF